MLKTNHMAMLQWFSAAIEEVEHPAEAVEIANVADTWMALQEHMGWEIPELPPNMVPFFESDEDGEEEAEDE